MPTLRLTGLPADPFLFPMERISRAADDDIRKDLKDLQNQVNELLEEVDDVLGPLPFSRSRLADDDRPSAA